jgi:SAM-dependent methyltransferase
MASVDGTEKRCCPQCDSREAVALDAYSMGTWRIGRCSACGFVYLLNPPDHHRLEDEFAWEKTFAAETVRRKEARPVVAAVDESTRWRLRLFSRDRQALYRRIFAPGRVLNVGCGANVGLPRPFIPYGIEISRELHARAVPAFRARGGEVVFGPAAILIDQFPAGYFSGVVLSSVLEHETEARKLLKGVARVLADSGVAYVRVPNFASLNRRVMGAAWCGFRYPDHVNYFTPESLRRMAAECGLGLRLLTPMTLPVNDNINGIMLKNVGATG